MNVRLSDNFVRFLINLALFLLLIVALFLSLFSIGGLALGFGMDEYGAELAFALVLLPLPILLTLIRRLINKNASAIWSLLKFNFWVYVVYTSLRLIIGLIDRVWS